MAIQLLICIIFCIEYLFVYTHLFKHSIEVFLRQDYVVMTSLGIVYLCSLYASLHCELLLFECAKETLRGPEKFSYLTYVTLYNSGYIFAKGCIYYQG